MGNGDKTGICTAGCASGALAVPSASHCAAKGRDGAGGFPGYGLSPEGLREGLGLSTGIYHCAEVTLIAGWILGGCVVWAGFYFFCQEVINAFLGIKIFLACPSCWCRKDSSNPLTFLRGEKKLFWRRWEVYVQIQGVSLFSATLSNLG